MARPDPTDPLISELLDAATFDLAGRSVTCAVSGGPDSTALLALAVAAGLQVTAVHVDHCLRAGSEHEADHVAETAQRWGASFRSFTTPVEPGGDLEARARTARRSVLPADTLWGHTADDQAETVVLRLLRGTGPAGLAAMRPDSHPILALRRSQTEQLCEHLGVTPLEDPMNDDARFTRNRVRHEVLPLLDDVAGRDVVPLLCRLAEQAAEQADALEHLAAPLDPTDVDQLRTVPEVLASTALRCWWQECTGGLAPPDRAATRRMLDVVRGTSVGCDVVLGWQLRRHAGRLRLVPPC